MEPGDSFPLFASLPYETRRQIWEVCPPARIIEFESPRESACRQQNMCALAMTRLNTRAPVASRVCRESLDVFLREYRILSFWSRERNTAMPNHRSHRFPIERFARTSTNTIYMDVPSTIYSGWALDTAKGPRLVSFMLGILGISWPGPRRFDPADEDRATEWEEGLAEQFVYLEATPDLDEYRVVLEDIIIHIPSMGDVTSGLFGLPGEEPVKAVEASDTDGIGRYRRLWEGCGSPDDEGAAAFFGKVSDSAGFREKIERWKRCATRRLVWDVMSRELANYYPIAQDPLLMGGESGEKAGSAPAFVKREDVLGMTRDNAHPAAAKVWQEIPRLRPMVVFRICKQPGVLPR